MVELSTITPFYLVIVTHKSSALFHETDKDKKKILDRFVTPINIELPETMAFKLMGAAMEKNKDQAILAEWIETAEDLNGRLKDSRKVVMKSAKIEDHELKAILPLHPYTALLLKQLAVAFASNQRSMFDFIKSDHGDDVKGFQWYIDNYGPYDEDCFLTIDMLWDFFYEKGKEHLAQDVRNVLDAYCRQNIEELSRDQKKVFKTILLLQAISQKVGDSVELFIPNEKNLNCAYDGTELEGGAASNVADSLVRAEILYEKPMGQGKVQYSVMQNTGDAGAIEKKKQELLKTKKTMDLVQEGECVDVIRPNGALRLRYEIKPATVERLKIIVNGFRNMIFKYAKIPLVVTFAQNDEERASLLKTIREVMVDPGCTLVLIDTSATPFGQDAMEQYIENMANSVYQHGKDNKLSERFGQLAKENLNQWKGRIESGEFIVYTNDKANGERMVNIEAVYDELWRIDHQQYPLALDSYKVIDNMYTVSSLKPGAKCAIEQKPQGTFRSSSPVPSRST